jgi:Leucine-rich repeat (LRR) protein
LDLGQNLVQEIVINGESVIDNASTEARAHLAKLQLLKLTLAGNRLDNYKTCGLLWELPALRVLDLSNNCISKIAGHGNKSKITELILNYNELRADNDSFKFVFSLPCLIILRLDDNCITSIQISVTNQKLQQLSLVGNYISRIADIEFVGKLTDLHSLDLSRNELKSFLFPLGQFLKLARLSLAENRIKGFTQIYLLGALPKLTVLHLQGNQLSEVMPQELQLEIAHNKLMNVLTLPHLMGFKCLQELNVSKNHLSPKAIYKLIKKMPNLKTLHCEGNLVAQANDLEDQEYTARITQQLNDVGRAELQTEAMAQVQQDTQRATIVERFKQLEAQRVIAQAQFINKRAELDVQVKKHTGATKNIATVTKCGLQ